MRSVGLLSFVFIVGLYAQEPATQSKQDELARVAILPFVDQTKSTQFAYLSESLADAIDRSMQAKFEYKRIPPNKAKAVARRALKSGQAMKEGDAAAMAKGAGFDIIISGFYTKGSAAAQEVIFHTAIYLADARKWQQLPVTRNPVDATLFQATDKVAATIVAEINRIAEEQAKADAVAEKEAEDRAEKLKLKRELGKNQKVEKAQAKGKSFEPKRWFFAFAPGVGYPTSDPGGDMTAIGATASLTWRIQRFLHIGMLAGYDRASNFADITNSAGTRVEYKVQLSSGAAFLGLAWEPGRRWRLYVDFGGGMYYSVTRIETFSSSGDTSVSYQFQNPLFVERMGVDFLLSQSLALGLQYQFFWYWDDPESLRIMKGNLVLSYAL